MTLLEQLESKLDEVLVKKAPFQLPENTRKWIAEYAWVFALVGLVFGVLAFFPMLAAVGIVSTFGVVVGAGYHAVTAWLSLAVLVAYLVVLGIAIPKLKAKQTSGWNLMYYSMLFFAVYDVIQWVRYPVVGFIGFVFNLAGLVVGLYLLFQVKSYFKTAKVTVGKPKAAPTSKK